MRKLILKTALISFAAAVGAVVLLILGCMLFAPAFVSDTAYNLGLEGVSVTFAENAYERSGKTEDLQKLVERAILAERYTATVTYAPKFVGCEDFEAVALEADALGGASGSYSDFITGSLAVALYKMGDTTGALQAVEGYTVSYQEFNTAEYLLFEVVSCEDKAFARELLAVLKGFTFEGDEQARLLAHISLLEGFID